MTTRCSLVANKCYLHWVAQPKHGFLFCINPGAGSASRCGKKSGRFFRVAGENAQDNRFCANGTKKILRHETRSHRHEVPFEFTDAPIPIASPACGYSRRIRKHCGLTDTLVVTVTLAPVANRLSRNVVQLVKFEDASMR